MNSRQSKPLFEIASVLALPDTFYWKIIADDLSKTGWSWGCVSAIAFNGRTIVVIDAHRGEDHRFVVRADEKLTAFVELESAIRVVSP